MGFIKREIARLTKEAGSKKSARQFAEKWYKDSLAKKSVTEVQYVPTPFHRGKIYVFEYDPITENLPWYDQNPIVLALNAVEGDDIGINLNLLPVKIKEQLLDDLYTRLEGQIKSASSGPAAKNATTQRPLVITYQGAKAYLDRYGFGFAIRRYKINRKTKQAVVSYQNWPQIALCDFIQLNGTSVWKIRRMFTEYNSKRNI